MMRLDWWDDGEICEMPYCDVNGLQLIMSFFSMLSRIFNNDVPGFEAGYKFTRCPRSSHLFSNAIGAHR